MEEIRANGAHDANGSANWCKLVHMAEIGANGAHDAVGSANLGKW